MDKQKLFQQLQAGYKAAHPNKTGKQQQDDVVSIWNSIKAGLNLPELVEKYLSEWKSKELQRKASLLSFWGKQSQQAAIKITSSSIEASCPPGTSTTTKTAVVSSDNKNNEEQYTCSSKIKPGISTRLAPAQQALNYEIDVLNADVVGLLKRKQSGMLTEVQTKELTVKKQKLKELEKRLWGKKLEMQRKRKERATKKSKVRELCEKYPELKSKLKVQEKTGRPSLENDQPLLLKAILDIAIFGSAAHEKRREESYRSVKTLSELTEKLKEDGYDISRSSVYLRLLPRRSLSSEGKCHVRTVPIKLIRPTTESHAKHTDTGFAMATMSFLEQLASLLGSQEVAFLSQDDKARVPLGLTAASKQAPILMHVEYRVALHDHDWVIANRHKLIPSVYAGIVIKDGLFGEREAVSYSGPTFIAIRSGKHSSSTASSHARDLNRVYDLPEFRNIMRTVPGNLPKPVLIITVDGGPDENPRYEKVIKISIHHFLTRNLDAVFVACNAPGRSSFNRVERRMAPLSRELAGLILPHDHYGSHLDAQGRTVDIEKEKMNFAFAGKTLAEVWSNTVIDEYPTITEYVDPTDSELVEPLLEKDTSWRNKHVAESQYLLQIVKCQDTKCCLPCRSSLFLILQNRILPPPVPLAQTPDGLKVAHLGETGRHQYGSLFVNLSLDISKMLPGYCRAFRPTPYDLYCPSVQSKLSSRICKFCGKYFASISNMKAHAKLHTAQCGQAKTELKEHPVRVVARRQSELMAILPYDMKMTDAEWIDEGDLDLTDVNVPKVDSLISVGLPITDVGQHLDPIWEDVK